MKNANLVGIKSQIKKENVKNCGKNIDKRLLKKENLSGRFVF